ncbi:serine/threonine-protein kinase [Ktedonobacter racemifer]|uniref:non-specific serine/threonine protein kinase n=1 Tax=Ktedonobacter racemifer DSM 44963 TaxID=485913 RepID=D6TK02_KTERA|nr:serine/threonine-protein kinase [Ktedonobacter racemifer]EFH89759.1 serine/threonine protein kinase with WD40 repeats [Ktedonobacter racemifer DSM 44963]
MALEALYCAYCGAGNSLQDATCFACQRQLTLPESEEETPFLVGERYLILAQVGLGGFGAVYKVLDTQEQNTVRALKQINLRNLTPQQAIEATDAFNREVSLLSQLTHAHLPRVYDHFTDPEHWYLVMGFIEGQTLESYLESQGAPGHSAQPAPLLAFEEIFSIALQLCDVLSYLHTRQPPVIFRDLKPSNIMRSPSGQLYLIDFGIARHFKPGQARDTIPFGSPGYAAPEQYGKAQTTPASDIYSLGALLHHLLSGEDPAENPFKFAPSYAYRQAGVTELATLVERMVRLDTTERPSTIAEVYHEILRIARNQGIRTASLILSSNQQARPHTPTQPLGMPGTAPGAGQVQVQVQAPTSKHSQPGRRFSRRAIVAGGLTLSVVTIAGGATIGGIQNLIAYLKAQETAIPENVLNDPKIIYSSAIAPDGRTCVSIATNIFLIWYIHTEQTIWAGKADIIPQVRPAWSPDSQRFATAVGDGSITIWDWQKQQKAQIVEPNAYSSANEVSTHLAWSPNGKYLAIAQKDGESQVTHFQILYLPTKQVIANYITPHEAILGLDWSPDSKRLATNNTHNTLQDWEIGVSRQPTHTYMFPQTQSNPPDHNDAVVRWSPDGRWIAAAPYAGPLSLWSPTTKQAFTFDPIASEPRSIFSDLAWSPDGRTIAAVDQKNIVYFWDTNTRKLLGSVPGPESGYGGSTLYWNDNQSVLVIVGYKYPKIVGFRTGARTGLWRGNTLLDQ